MAETGSVTLPQGGLYALSPCPLAGGDRQRDRHLHPRRVVVLQGALRHEMDRADGHHRGADEGEAVSADAGAAAAGADLLVPDLARARADHQSLPALPPAPRRAGRLRVLARIRRVDELRHRGVLAAAEGAVADQLRLQPGVVRDGGRDSRRLALKQSLAGNARLVIEQPAFDVDAAAEAGERAVAAHDAVARHDDG